MSANWSFADRVSYVPSHYSNASEYYEVLRRYKFVACPEGLGIDTHRVWEALYLNVTPSVVRNRMQSAYCGLDVLVVDGLNEVPAEIWTHKKERVDATRLSLHYWTREVHTFSSRTVRRRARTAGARNSVRGPWRGTSRGPSSD